MRTLTQYLGVIALVATLASCPEVKNPPVTPTNLLVIPRVSSIDLRWDAIPDATEYSIERQVDTDLYVALSSVSVAQFTDTGVTDAHSYRYRIKASNTSGSSAWAQTAEMRLPVVTPAGTPVGSAVMQHMDGVGGTINAGGIGLKVPAGVLTNSSITLQPIADTLNGAGQGIAISSDEAWGKFVVVSFPIEAGENPENLGLAVQQADGSWRALEPVKVDTVAGTVSAGLPANTEVNTSSLRAQGGLNLKNVVKFERFYLKPGSATVKVKATKVFVPYARVSEIKCVAPPTPLPPTGDPEIDDLAPVCPTKVVTREYPFTNEKAGFFRWWFVAGVNGGNSTVGTITKSGTAGATYTAPNKKPSPETVTVKFTSMEDADAPYKVDITAQVTIVAPAYRVSGSAGGGSLSGVTCDTNEAFTLDITYGGGSTAVIFQPSSDTGGTWSGSGSVAGGATVDFNGSYSISADPGSSENASLNITGTAVVTSDAGAVNVPLNGTFTMTALPPC